MAVIRTVEAVPNGVPATVLGARTGEETQMSDDATKRDFGDKLRKIFDGLIEVRVFTILHDITVDISTVDDKTRASVGPIAEQVPALITIFNLVDGDVINVIAPSLQENAELRAFHTAQVDKSLAVLPRNIEAMVTLGKAILDEFS